MSRPVIGRDWHGRTRTARTAFEAFGVDFHAERRRLGIDLDYLVGAFVVGVVTAVLLGIVL